MNLSRVAVHPPGLAPFELSVLGLAVEAEPGPAAGPVAVTVRGALAFSGLADAVPYRIDRPTVAAGGIVRLSTDADVLAVRAGGRSLRVDVALGWGAAVVRGLRLPCDAVGLGHHRPPAFDPAAPPADDGTTWTPAGRTLVLRARWLPKKPSRPTVLRRRAGRIQLLSAGESQGDIRG